MTKEFMQVYDQELKRVAVLQNAFNIKEEQQINQIYTLSFQMPSTDGKLSFCQPFTYFRFGNQGQVYRQIKNPKQNNEVSIDTITCEHAIATLCDNVMFGAHTFGGTGTHTSEVIEYILSHQSVQNWVLGECDFDFAYEYNWEQENLLNALYSVPEVFAEPYIWTFDFSRTPWLVNLKRIDVNVQPSYYIRAKRNLISDSAEIDYTNICTRLYPLGYGEGINQLTIKDVNNGDAYLDAPAEIVAKYGIKEKVLVDRKFEDAETLKAYAQTVLDAMTVPAVSRKFDVVDLYPITSQDIDNAEVGKICKLTEDNTIAYVTKTTRILDDPGNLQIDLSTKATDVVAQLADMADRVRIESVYAQGATQLYQHSKDANATPEKGMVISLYFPSEMKQINKVLLRMKLEQFRSYSMTTESYEFREESTEEGGGVYKSSESGGGTSKTTTSESSSRSTTSSTAMTSSYVPTAPASVEGFTGYADVTNNPNHRHYATLGNHIHTISPDLFAHSHGMSHKHDVPIDLDPHTHMINIPPHQHWFTLPAHSHDIAAGIYESGNPTGFDIVVDGTTRATVDSRSYNDDITMWLLDDNGLVPRNRWIDMTIVPNDNAYVVASVFIQGFVQSRGGGNY